VETTGIAASHQLALALSTASHEIAARDNAPPKMPHSSDAALLGARQAANVYKQRGTAPAGTGMGNGRRDSLGECQGEKYGQSRLGR
jgi:hypothetical protein